MRVSRVAVEGLVLASIAAAVGVANACWGVGADPAGLTAGALTLAGGAATSAIGNFTDRQFCRAAAGVADFLAHPRGRGAPPLNPDLPRAVRLAQIHAVEVIARRAVAKLKADSSEADRSAELTEARLDAFLDDVLKWKRAVEKTLKGKALDLLKSEVVAVVAREVRALLSSPGDGDAATRAAEIWARAGRLILAELDSFPVRERPGPFDAAISGEGDIDGVTWPHAALAFFAEALKSREEVFRIVSVNLLQEIGGANARLAADLHGLGGALLRAMQERLGPVGRSLAHIDERLEQLQAAANESSERLSAKLDRVLAILTSAPDADARLDRWTASEYADFGLTAARVRDLIEESTRFFVGREPDLGTLDGFVSGRRRGLLVVAAPAGVGKSALLAEWMGRRRELGDFVARHIIARRAPETVGSTAVLEHLLRQIHAYRSQAAASIPDTDSKLADAIFNHLKVPARTGERLIVLIDGLDETDRPLAAFARREMGEGVFVVLGVRADPEAVPEILRRWLSGGLGDLPVSRHDLKPLTVDEVGQWLHAVVPVVRLIDEREIAAALHRTTDGVPLFLRFVIDDLVRILDGAGIEEARRALAALPAPFTAFVRERVRELDEIKDGAWGAAPRKLFALLTQTLGPISTQELRKGGLVPADLNLRALDHRIERWFSISGDVAARAFTFAHPRLAKVFGEVLGDEAEEARTALCTHCEAWAEHGGEYALAFAPDHLIAAAEESGRSGAAVERAAAPLLSLDFHRMRLGLSTSDELMARASLQLRALAGIIDALG